MNRKVLLIGYGNPGRRDDGLGPALAAGIERLGIPDVRVESDYQLTVEDAVDVAGHQVVIFADADCRGPAPFSFSPLQPAASQGFSSHGIEPQEVLGLAQTLFGRRPEAYLLGIRGYDFEPLQERLTAQAEKNLEASLRFLKSVLNRQSFRESARRRGRKT